MQTTSSVVADLQQHIRARIAELETALRNLGAQHGYDSSYDDGQLAVLQEIAFFLKLRTDIRINGKLLIGE